MPLPPGSKIVSTSVTPPKPPPSGTLYATSAQAPARKAVKIDIKKYSIYFIYIFAALFLAYAAYSLGHSRRDDRPDPNPAPAPISGTLWVTLVHDSDNPTQEFAHIESDNSLVEFINLQKGHLRIVEKDSKLVKSHNFSQFVDKYGLPTLIIQSEESKKITAEKCPDTANKIIDEIKKYKGIK